MKFRRHCEGSRKNFLELGQCGRGVVRSSHIPLHKKCNFHRALYLTICIYWKCLLASGTMLLPSPLSFLANKFRGHVWRNVAGESSLWENRFTLQLLQSWLGKGTCLFHQWNMKSASHGKQTFVRGSCRSQILQTWKATSSKQSNHSFN